MPATEVALIALLVIPEHTFPVYIPLWIMPASQVACYHSIVDHASLSGYLFISSLLIIPAPKLTIPIPLLIITAH
jgi:hypothetical protein